MGIFSWLKRSVENPKTPITEAELLSALGGSPTVAGTSVTEKSAMRNVAVFACVRILAESVASLPLFVYRRTAEGGRERANDHPSYSVLHDAANPEMTAMTFRETVQGHAASWGNGYAYIVRKHGWVTELWPLLPDRTVPVRVDGAVAYRVTLANGEQRMLHPLDVLHIPGFGYDGLQGYNPIRLARESIGLGMAAEEFGARFFGQGTNLGGVVEHPGKLGQTAHENLRQSLAQKHQGLGRAHLLLILEEGMKYQRIGVAPNDAQFLETRKFQVTDIARLFRVPPHMIADLDRATFSNIEHESIEFVVHSLRPWLVRWEQAINVRLFTPRERREYYAEHLIDGLLRGDSKSRAEALATLRQNGIINADEWRAMENLNPQDGGVGKTYLVNSAMVSVPVPLAPVPVAEPRAAVPEQRSTASRRRLARSFEAMFVDAGRRIGRREKADIARQGLKHLNERSVDSFEQWLEDFYREAPEWIARIITPVAMSYADAVGEAAAREIGLERDVSSELAEYVQRYVESFARQHTAASLGQLRAVIRQAIEENADLVEAVGVRLDEWEERRPEKIATVETIRAGNGAALAVFGVAGVARLVWHAAGPKPCPYCTEMDGKVVSMGRSFLETNDVLESDDGRMQLYRPTTHPPLHFGCVCQIAAG